MADTGNMKIGILGEGQLARMLIEGAEALGLHPRIFAASEDSPAGRISKDCVVGRIEDSAKLRAFLDGLDTVAFENEFLDTALLKKSAEGLKAAYRPSLETLHRLQDKFSQKKIFESLGLPQPAYEALDSSAEDAIRGLWKRYPQGLVLKWSRMGYDGKGVKILSHPSESDFEAIRDFIEQGEAKGALVYAEPKIAFRSELAIVAVRSIQREFKSYPLVFSEQQNGICKKVWGPAFRFGLDADLDAKASAMARTLAEGLDLVGSFALELFLTPEGNLLINEAAPRVHNSGHYTQDACACSQFENHWRALLDLPLGSTETRPYFGMLNLLGPEHPAKKDGIGGVPQVSKDLVLHWYEKGEIRPLRKLGHLNWVAEDEGEFQRKLAQAEDADHKWMKGEA